MIGIKRNMLTMRMARLSKLMRKEMVAFPKPLIMLIKVAFKYKKGQIHARIVIKLPAKELENTNSPRNFPNNKKKIVQTHPKKIQKKEVFLMVLFNAAICPDA